MINTNLFFKFLKKNGIDFFTGVPDSILKETKQHFSKKKNKNHFITANEGSAIAMAIGYNLATKKLPCVYMQNSGLGNAINPLSSIAHKKVYSIPMLLLIGWRGSPGIKDEPQHMIKGKITTKLLKLLNIKYCVLKNYNDLTKLKKIISFSKKNNEPVACLVPKNVLKNNKLFKNKLIKLSNIKRYEIIEELLKMVKPKTKIISTTGFASRELNQIRKEKNLKKGNDFYMVGGMGHTSMVALSTAMNTNNQVICLDGDGSFLMHLGAVVSIGKIYKKNFKHILFNNYSHESVGGQSTNIEKLNIRELVLSAGYKNYFKIKNKNDIIKFLKKFLVSDGPSFLEVKINQGSIQNLKRPNDFINIKKEFIKHF